MLRITDVVRHLLIINILMFIADKLVLSNWGASDMLALHYPGSDLFRPYQFVTYFFMHANFMHILFNMYALVMFGSALEVLWGAKHFLFYYIACALGAAALHLLVNYIEFSQMQSAIAAFQANPDYDTFWAFFSDVPLNRLGPDYKAAIEQLSSAVTNSEPGARELGVQAMRYWMKANMDVPVVGASGAIYGLLLAFGMKFPNAELMLIFLPIPIKAKYFIPILVLIELYLGVNQFSWDNIAHFAHLGGALVGLLLILFGNRLGARY